MIRGKVLVNKMKNKERERRRLLNDGLREEESVE